MMDLRQPERIGSASLSRGSIFASIFSAERHS
jgi:hypothetical protein